ncbi:peroxin-11C Pex11C-Penicillium chrysogenum [Penicillium mononematosum]|uniref:peroxin-11C Pex11C-Penicillium chrysogenum n=1 Tax=Penicillium mononematosum TaxID=268346 RepID=UPI0025466B61|nr:peroxin-11C Pex11C-Penicillium chrysogenum [Penicillium mononematosum]KAJ6184002.1 peroxin-11C Pex11C-Penicillium chrysogenum [Penicillium mononematosum]
MSDPERPSGEATDVQAGKAPAMSSCAKRQLLAALTTTDVTIRRLDLLLSEANGQERVLATINYVASMLHHLTAVVYPKNVTPASSKSKFAALCSLASETRYNLRLFGLLPLWIWGAETLKSPPADPILHALTVLQVISNVIYQLLENVGYLASKGVVSKRFVDKYGGVAKWDIWSTRGWFGHIFFQFFVLWRQSVLRRQRLAAQRAAAGTVETKETKAEDSEALRLEIRAWRKSLVNNVFWAPLCLHWCFEKGIGIPDSMVGIISFCAGAWSLHDCWAGTATVKA